MRRISSSSDWPPGLGIRSPKQRILLLLVYSDSIFDTTKQHTAPHTACENEDSFIAGKFVVGTQTSQHLTVAICYASIHMLFTGHDQTRGSGREVFKYSRIGSGRVTRYSISHGWGWVIPFDPTREFRPEPRTTLTGYIFISFLLLRGGWDLGF